jgi:hypothetical protein
MSQKIGTVIIDILADTTKLVAGMEGAQKSIKKNVEALQKSIIGIGAAFLSVQTVMKAFDIGKEFTSTAMEFEKFNTVLETIEGSSQKADSAMAWIADFTKSTPYELAEVTDAFVKLRAYGLNPTDGTLKTLGDTASAMGKSLNQAVEAMADAVTGENERLKEFGIKASKTGEEITYKWTSASGEARSKTIENNSAIIQSTLSAIFNEKYAGAMDAQSKTLEGMLSNISDSYTIFQKNVMDSGLYDYIKALVKVFGEELNKAFGTTSENAGAFANSMIDAINSTINAVGFLKDSFTGIQVVVKSIEIGFLYMVKGITFAIDSIIGAMNAVLVQYNDLPSALRGEQVDLFSKFGVGAVSQEIADSKTELAGLVNSISDGRNFAENFTKRVGIAFQEFKTTIDSVTKSTDIKNKSDEKSEGLSKKQITALEKQSQLNERMRDTYLNIIGSDYDKWLVSTNSTMIDLAKSTELTSDELMKAFDKLSESNPELKVKTADPASLQVWSDYYKGIGDLQTAWLTSQERVDAHDNAVLLGLKDEDYNVYIERYKTNFLDQLKDKTKESTDEVKYVFTNAFKGMEDTLIDFVKTGKVSFENLVNSILEDLLRLQIQMSITKPLMASFEASGGVGSIASMFGFANGGVMTNQGAVPLKAYANGGIATTPQLALYGEGRMPEAYVPLPDGRTIPVTMQGGSGANVLVNIENNSGTPVSENNVTTSFDGGTMIVNIVLDAITRNKGGMRDAIRSTK